MSAGIRAEAIHYQLTLLRQYTTENPSWNVAINLNGPLWGSVEVKVWHGTEVKLVLAERDAWLSEMLEQATQYMEEHLGALDSAGASDTADGMDSVSLLSRADEIRRNKRWLDFGTCVRCKATMGQPCRRVDTGAVMKREHYGRPRFSKEHEVAV
jgi:hypothetical protein